MTIESFLKEAQIPQQKQFNQLPFPLVYTPATSTNDALSLQSFLKQNKDSLMQKLKQHGAILLRGFSINEPKDFNDVVEALGMSPLPYVGGAAPRTKVHGGVFTSNESPPSEVIPFHHEMAQVPKYPSFIFFYCHQEPKSGGETPLLRSDQLFELLNEQQPDFIKQLIEKGLKYTRVLPPKDDPTSAIGRSWPSTFQTEDFEEAKTKAKQLGVELEMEPSGNVKSVSHTLPAIKSYQNKTVFFNSMVAAYTGWRDSRNTPEQAVKFGTDEPLPKKEVEKVKQLMDEICVAVPWQKGDIFCIDNHLVMHARKNFEPPRKILAYVAQ